jgi:hypothetical protein
MVDAFGLEGPILKPDDPRFKLILGDMSESLCVLLNILLKFKPPEFLASVWEISGFEFVHNLCNVVLINDLIFPGVIWWIICRGQLWTLIL